MSLCHFRSAPIMLELEIQEALEAWVERGRQREAIAENGLFVLRYGRRFRLQCLGNLGGFVLPFCFGLLVIPIGGGDRSWFEVVFLYLFGAMSCVAAVYLTYVLTSRVDIAEDSVTVRCFGRIRSECHRSDLMSAYKSLGYASVVLVQADGKKTRISTQLDGLGALFFWLCRCPVEVLTDSIRAWMVKQLLELRREVVAYGSTGDDVSSDAEG